MTESRTQLANRSFQLIAPAAAVALYARTVGFDLVWDDRFLIFLPSTIGCHLPSILFGPGNGLEYLPVRDLALCIEHRLFGNRIGGFHLFNALVFGAAIHQVQALYRELFSAAERTDHRQRSVGLSFVCALLFALHPIHVEPVAFITGLNALLALLFTAMALRYYARSSIDGDSRAYSISIALTALALFSKATASALPLLLLGLHLYCVRSDSVASALRRVFPHLAITIAAIVIHFAVARATGVMDGAADLGWTSRLMRTGFIPLFYSWKLLWPLELSNEYILTGLQDFGLWIALSTIGLALATSWIALRWLRDRTLWAFLFLACIASLAPVSNIFPTVPPVADRYAEIFAIFLVPLIALPVATRLPSKLALGLAAVVILVFTGLTHRQIGVWETEESLFGHATRLDPRASESWRALGHAYWREGRLPDAQNAFRHAAEVDPEDALFSLFMGSTAYSRGDLLAAQSWLQKALEKEGSRHQVYAALGALYDVKRDPERAIANYERALEEIEKSPSARTNVEFTEQVRRDLQWLRTHRNRQP